jgi:ADP-ribose pyrophosphatase
MLPFIYARRCCRTLLTTSVASSTVRCTRLTSTSHFPKPPRIELSTKKPLGNSVRWMRWAPMALGIAASATLLASSQAEAKEKIATPTAQTKVVPGVPAEVMQRYEKYLQLLEKYPSTLGPNGDADKGEIEVIVDPLQMWEIERLTKRTVGIVAEDTYWSWINDAVLFPGRKPGVYGRIVWNKALDGVAGVAVMPILPDGRIALNCNYRHATRSWEYELPRGVRNKNEKIEDAAKREAQEETGLELEKLDFVGIMPPDSGLTNSLVPLFIAKVTKEGQANPEDSEAITSVDAFTVEELKQGFKQGFLIHTNKDGSKSKVPCRDPFLAFVVLQMIVKEVPGPNK